MTGKIDTDAARARAEARFQAGEQRKSDAEKVMQEIRDAKVAELAKTERLKALRVAKEVADREAAAAAPPVKATRRKSTAAAR